MNEEVVERVLSCLGKGFDVANDFRVKYCKGEGRLVAINEDEKRELVVPGFAALPLVSVDIMCDKGDRIRYQSDILNFNQMSSFMNERSSLVGKIPNGLFNTMFGFNCETWAWDGSHTKCLAMDAYFITLFSLRLSRSSFRLSHRLRRAVPTSWNPLQLARFIEKYGTHIIVGVSIGGQDVVLVRQDQSSHLPPSQLKKHLENLGDQLFTGACTLSSKHYKTRDNKNKIPEVFNVFDPQPNLLDSFTTVRSKDGITVIYSKRGGDTTINNHSEWLPTVSTIPDAINFNFLSIISLLKKEPGKGYLSHAINLYLRYKPPMADLPYFLDFQSPKIWAPIHSDFPLGPSTNKSIATAALNVSFMSPKLSINTSKVTVGKRPVTGMRLYLEGNKCNRLAIHLQHLSNVPAIFANHVGSTPIWGGSDEVANQGFFAPWKSYSYVCTAPVELTHHEDIAHVVTGAQLLVKKQESKNILHLRLQFSKISDCIISRSSWDQGSQESSPKSSSFFTALSTSITGSSDKEKQSPTVIIDSGVCPEPPAPVQRPKLLKIIDTKHMCRCSQDSPGHWLVSGAKLDLEKGKISLRVKFSLLVSSSWEHVSQPPFQMDCGSQKGTEKCSNPKFFGLHKIGLQQMSRSTLRKDDTQICILIRNWKKN